MTSASLASVGVPARPGGVVLGQDAILDRFLVGQFLGLFFNVLVGCAEDHEAAHLALLVVGRGLVDFL